MSRDAFECPRLCLLQRHRGSRFLLGLGLCLRNRDDGPRTNGPRWRRTRNTERSGACHARGYDWGRCRGNCDDRRTLVSGDVGEDPLKGFFGGRRTGPMFALDLGRSHACAQIGGAGGAWDDGRGVVRERDFASLEG